MLSEEALLFEHLWLVASVGAMWCSFEALVVGYEEPRLCEDYDDAFGVCFKDIPRVGVSSVGGTRLICPALPVGAWNMSESSWYSHIMGR